MTIKIPHLGRLAAPKLKGEAQRLDDLYAMKVLGTASEKRFDQFTQLAASVFDVPLSAISFVDESKQWFKSMYGFDQRETPRELGFCQHAILVPEIMVIEDVASDPRFADNPMVLGEPHLRFYAGAVIRSASGQPVGTCCVLDTQPRTLSARKRSILLLIARMVEAELQLVREVAALKKKVKKVILHDSATGLPNLALFTSQLGREVARASTKSRQLLLALIRVDHFDALEAALGRDAAIYLLSKLAERIRERLGSPSFIGHTREDELALLTVASEQMSPEQLLDRLLECNHEPFVLVQHTVPLRVSVGASLYPEDADSPESLLKRARTALWSKPVSEQSGYRRYRRQQSDRASEQFQIAAALKQGLENDEFHLVFQPKIDIRRHQLVGAEALIRWKSAVLGDVPPATFIPVAEQSGLIAELGTWVLLAACRQLAHWNEIPCGCPEVSINVSSYQLRRPDFLQHVEGAIAQHKLARGQLNIELTESSLVDDLPGAVRIMKRLREFGVKISIDDFGTGFSSLSYLRRMPIQILKIDRSFVKNIPKDRDDMKLVRSIVSMGHDLELDVVAEGVETRQQLSFLRSIGCDQVQGYIFSPPLTSEKFLECAEKSTFTSEEGEQILSILGKS